MLISRTNSLTQTHAVFLEWFCLKALREADRYSDENGNQGSRPHTPAPLEADCLEIFDTGSTLLASLGYPLFSQIAKGDTDVTENQLYYCTSAGAEGRGQYTSEGFVVLKGSKARKENQPSLGSSGEKLRYKLLETGVVKAEGDLLIFQKDYLFGSPSTAALAVLGRRANGWMEWKNAQDETLDAIERQMEDDALCGENANND